MCRLFAITSKEPTKADFWFFKAKTPFKDFSEREINKGPHNSGWGIGWINNNQWNVFKQGKEDSAKYDFSKVKEIKSNIILIHLRHASVGSETVKNAHPFVYNHFIFEHNGGVDRESLIKSLDSKFKDKIKTDTDSEIYFLLIMQFFEKSKDIIKSIKETVNLVKKYQYRGLNFILSDSENLYVFRDVSPEHKEKYDYYCLNYLVIPDKIIISSDPLTDENWIPLKLGELISISKNLEIKSIKI